MRDAWVNAREVMKRVEAISVDPHLLINDLPIEGTKVISTKELEKILEAIAMENS